MDNLDLQLLRRCCRPASTEMDETEVQVVEEILMQFLILDLNVNNITHCLYTGGYISEVAFRNIRRVLEKGLNQNELKVNKRVIAYLTNKISFVALLWALSTCGYQTFANLLLSSLDNARCSTISSQVKKTPVIRSRAMYTLVKQLKYISDSKTFNNPVAFIRRLAMRFKEQFLRETEVNHKRKLADRYFGVLAVELDNFSFIKNRYVSVKALESELKRVVPFTSNPNMNEALVNGRVAEVTAISGDVSAAVSRIQDTVAVILNTEACQESANLFYLRLNILLRSYERSPSAVKKKYYIEMGYIGLRLLPGFDKDLSDFWKVSFMMRIIFCALDLSINGEPIGYNPYSGDSLETAQYFLTEVERNVYGYGLRKLMSFYLAMGRMSHIRGRSVRAIVYLRKAKELAKHGGFIEFRHINEYERRLSVDEHNLKK